MKTISSLPLAVCVATLLSVSNGMAADAIPDSCKISGFAMGCQAWTFNRFSAMEAIDKTAEAGGKVIEFYSNQKLSPEQGSGQFGPSSSEEVIAKVKERLTQKNIRAVSFGVVDIPNDEAGARKIFDFAKKMGMYSITTESVAALDTIEKLVKEYDIRVGIHNHPKRPTDANYKVWDPNYVLSVVKDRDPRIGSTADIGHWVRSGLDPLDCLKILKGRIVTVHLKDLNEKSANAHDVPYGTGISNIKAILDELKAQNFVGNISVEYEYKVENNLPEVTECIKFVKAYGEK